jgi:hypothetical protein
MHDPFEALEEIAAQLDPETLAGAILFCPHHFDAAKLAWAINLQTEGVRVIGCTSSGELTERGYDHDSLSAIGFPPTPFASPPLLPRHRPFRPRRGARAGPPTGRAGRARKPGAGRKRQPCRAVPGRWPVAQRRIAGDDRSGRAGRNPAGRRLLGRRSRFKPDSDLRERRLSPARGGGGDPLHPRPLHVFRRQHYKPGERKMVITGALPHDRIVTEINAEPAAQEYLRLAGHAGRNWAWPSLPPIR